MTAKFLHVFMALAMWCAVAAMAALWMAASGEVGRATMGLGLMAVEFTVVAMVLMQVEHRRHAEIGG